MEEDGLVHCLHLLLDVLYGSIYGYRLHINGNQLSGFQLLRKDYQFLELILYYQKLLLLVVLFLEFHFACFVLGISFL